MFAWNLIFLIDWNCLFDDKQIIKVCLSQWFKSPQKKNIIKQVVFLFLWSRQLNKRYKNGIIMNEIVCRCGNKIQTQTIHRKYKHNQSGKVDENEWYRIVT